MEEVNEKKIKSIVSKVEINELMSIYEMMLDHYDMDAIEDHIMDFLDIFTENCVIDYEGYPPLEGKDEYGEFLMDYYTGDTTIVDCFHFAANPVIEVNNDTASGQWNFFGPYTYKEVGAAWHFSWYDNKFKRVNGEWKIDRITLTTKYKSPYQVGWKETPIAEELTNNS